MANDRELFRIANRLADGRTVYFSKRGKVHMMSRMEAEQAVAMAVNNRDPAKDPSVYAADLSMYGNRSLFLGALLPFVMVRGTSMESASAPIDPAAFVLGAVPAAEAGTYSKDQRP
jgi:hypothetical protein